MSGWTVPLQKLEWLCYTWHWRPHDRSSFLWTKHGNVTDRRMDGQTDVIAVAITALALRAMRTRCKNGEDILLGLQTTSAQIWALLSDKAKNRTFWPPVKIGGRWVRCLGKKSGSTYDQYTFDGRPCSGCWEPCSGKKWKKIKNSTVKLNWHSN